jgi:molybdopterin synthase catalytic subunit
MKTEIVFTHEPIVATSPALPSREIGACVEFQGIVREIEQGQPLAGLHYEAYESMARRILDRHFAELGAKHPCAAVLFVHRLGWVPVGEASLFIRVLSAHRGEALAFLAECIDRLKTDVPVWKMPPAKDATGAKVDL